MKRVFKFLAVLFGTALVIFTFIFAFNWNAIESVFRNTEGLSEGSQWVEKTYSLKGLSEYIGENPEHVSMVSYTLNAPEDGIYYRADVKRQMGALTNLFIAAEYLRQVEAGSLSSSERVALEAIEQHALPNIGSGTHGDVLEQISSSGKLDADRTLPLSYLVELMVVNNDLPISDFLYHHVGGGSIRALVNRANLKQTDAPLPFNGLYITIKPQLYDMSAEQRLEHLSYHSPDSLRSEVLAASQNFLADSDFRERVLDGFSDNGLDILLTEQRDLQTLFPKSTARDMTALMAAIHRGDFLSRAVSDQLLELLSWPMRERQMDIHFEQYSAMYDNRLGLLNGIDTGSSSYTDDRYVQAVFFDRLPVAFWLHMSSNHMHQDFQQRLIWDPALREAVRAEINPGER